MEKKSSAEHRVSLSLQCEELRQALTPFVVRPAPKGPYATLEEELVAVASGRKAISKFTFEDLDVLAERPNSQYQELLEQSLHMDLWVSLVLDTWSGGHAVYVFVYTEANSWRVHSLVALARVLAHRELGWSRGMEYLEGNLLGYSDEEIRARFSELHAIKPDVAGSVLYLFFHRSLLANFEELGMRAVPASAFTADIYGGCLGLSSMFTNDAAHVVEDLVIARASMRLSAVQSYFEQSVTVADPLLLRKLSSSQIASINRQMSGVIEILTANGWG